MIIKKRIEKNRVWARSENPLGRQCETAFVGRQPQVKLKKDGVSLVRTVVLMKENRMC